MPEAIDAEVARIRRRIRRWREEEGLTLHELAVRSGLATSTIQKVEKGQMIPSVAVLLKVARGLGRRATDLVHDGDPDPDVVQLRADDRHPIGMHDRIQVERLSAHLRDPALEMWRVRLHPGVSSGEDSIQYEGEELIVCESGEVTLRVGEQEYRLSAGDSLHFKAEIPHSWFNDTGAPACFTVTGTLPSRFHSLIRERLAQVAGQNS